MFHFAKIFKYRTSKDLPRGGGVSFKFFKFLTLPFTILGKITVKYFKTSAPCNKNEWRNSSLSIFYGGLEKACSIPGFIIYIPYILWYFRLKHLYYKVDTNKYLAVTLHVLSKLDASHSLNSANRDSLRNIHVTY